MGVQRLFYSDHDGYEKAIQNPETLMFTTKKEADDHDRALDFAMSFAEFMQGRTSVTDPDVLEEIGLVIAKNSKVIMQGLKKPDQLVADAEAPGSDNLDHGDGEA